MCTILGAVVKRAPFLAFPRESLLFSSRLYTDVQATLLGKCRTTRFIRSNVSSFRSIRRADLHRWRSMSNDDCIAKSQYLANKRRTLIIVSKHPTTTSHFTAVLERGYQGPGHLTAGQLPFPSIFGCSALVLLCQSRDIGLDINLPGTSGVCNWATSSFSDLTASTTQPNW
jgi:hypothetical protein